MIDPFAKGPLKTVNSHQFDRERGTEGSDLQLPARSVLKYLFGYLKPFLPLFVLAVVLTVVTRGLLLVLPQLFSHLVDSATGQVSKMSAHTDALLLFVVLVIAAPF